MTYSTLPIINLLGKKGRSAALLVFAVLLSLSIFGGALLLAGLGNGLRSLERRLGADIIVVPYEARTKVSADTILNQGNRTAFYMSRANLAKVAQLEGVQAVSPQIYLCSMNAGCCSVSLQLIGFDPESDFTIQPWMRESYGGPLGTGDILIGSKVTLPASRTLKFFDVSCHVAAQLDDTGTGLDNAVYANLDTIQLLLDSAATKDFSFASGSYSDKMISTIMVKVADGYDIDDVAGLIQRRVRKTVAVKTKAMTSGIAQSLASFAKIIAALSAVVWALCLVILVIVSSLVIGERKKEFAVLRVMGASRRKLARLVMAESLAVNAAGGMCGIALALLVVLPFHALISESLALPFLLPSPALILALSAASLALSVLCGCLAASHAARSIARIDTGVILREGN